MHIPLVDLQAQYASIKPVIDATIARVLASCAFAGGPEVRAFEEAFATYCGTKHCIGVSSGTSALEIIFRAYGIGPGDEVIVPANTFFASAEAVSITGAVPVFADVDERTALLDPVSVRSAITPRTRAICAVHLYGQPAPMGEILAIAGEHHIKVIEDCAQAHGALYRGKKAGSLGDAAAFSFYPGKNLGAYGEGGAIVTNDDAVTEFCRLFRDHGSRTKYEHAIVARNDRLDGLQGAILGAKLPFLDDWNTARRTHAARYRSLLDGKQGIRFFEEPADTLSACHLLVVQVPEDKRDSAKQALNDQKIGAGVHYPVPLHLQPAYANLKYPEGRLPVSEALCSRILSLPLYPEMTDEHVVLVSQALLALLA